MGMGGWAWRLLILTRLFLNENVLELLEFWWLLVGFGMHWDGGYWRWRCIPPSCSSCWLHNPFWAWRLWWLLVGFGTHWHGGYWRWRCIPPSCSQCWLHNPFWPWRLWWLLVGFGTHWHGGYWRWRCVPLSCSSCWPQPFLALHTLLAPHPLLAISLGMQIGVAWGWEPGVAWGWEPPCQLAVV